MPREFVAVVKHPQKSQPETKQREQGGDETLERNRPGDRTAILAHQLDAPGAHAQGLSAAHPEAAVEQKTDGNQIKLVKSFNDQAWFGAAGQIGRASCRERV